MSFPDKQNVRKLKTRWLYVGSVLIENVRGLKTTVIARGTSFEDSTSNTTESKRP